MAEDVSTTGGADPDETLQALLQVLAEDDRIRDILPVGESIGTEDVKVLGRVFAELILWLHNIDVAQRKLLDQLLEGASGEAWERLARLIQAQDAQDMTFRSELIRSLRLGRPAPLEQYCFQFMFKYSLAVPEGYRLACKGSEGWLKRELNPSKWCYSRKAFVESRGGAMIRHFTDSVRQELPGKMAADLCQEAATQAIAQYDRIGPPLRGRQSIDGDGTRRGGVA